MVKYVTIREFNLFKAMIKDRLFKNSKKPYELAELMIQGFERADKRIDELTGIMIGQFDRLENKMDIGFDKIDKRIDGMDEKLNKLLGHFNIK
jgi:hypothetical protein